MKGINNEVSHCEVKLTYSTKYRIKNLMDDDLVQKLDI